MNFLSAAHRESRDRRVASLRKQGWKQLNGNGVWVNPRTGRGCDLESALDIEDLRGTFARESVERHREKNRTSPKRPRGRPKKVSL